MKYTAFFILGLIIFITPFLGITTEWKLLITKVAGAIIVLGVIIRHYYVDSLLYENQTFDEHIPEEDVDIDEDFLDEEDIELVEIEDVDSEVEEEEIEDDEESTLEDRSV